MVTLKRATLCLLCLGALPLLAQQPAPQYIPITPQNVDLVSFVTKQLDALIQTGSPMFVDLGLRWLGYVTVPLVVFLGLDIAFGWGYSSGQLIKRLVLSYAVSLNLLLYWTTPMPLLGISFSQMFLAEGRFLAGMIDIAGLNLMLSKFAFVFANMQKPSVLVPQETIVYFLVLGQMVLVSAAMFFTIIQSFIYLGVALMLTPIFIPLRGAPFASGYASACFNCIVKYSLMRIVASALVFVWGSVLIAYMDTALHNDFSLAHFSAMLPVMLTLNITAAGTIFGIRHFVSDLTTGGANAVGSSGGALMSIARMII